MPKYRCLCGYVFHLSAGRESYDLILIKNANVEDIGNAIVKNKGIDVDSFFEKVDLDSRTVYWCPSCRRLHVSTPDLSSNNFEIYKREV